MARIHRRGGSTLALLVAGTILVPVPATAQDATPPADEGPANPYLDGPAPGSGAGLRIGYLELGDIPFVAVVSAGIREQAAIAGVELIECDVRSDPDRAILCARQLAEAGAQGILNYQAYADVSGQVCSAHGGLPTIAIDIHQDPCEVAFVGADNRTAGIVAGEAIGAHVLAETGCRYDVVYELGAGFVGQVSVDRVGGMREGFERVCGPIPEARTIVIDAGGSEDITFELMSVELAELPPDSLAIVLSINEEVGRGALAAAQSLDREGDVRIASQGAETSLLEIACEPAWIVSTAYAPERYGHILVAAMIDFLDGGSIPTELYLPHVAVTAENVRERYEDVPACE